MIEKYCIIGRKSLPALPCNFENCPWFVYNEDYANCFWVVAEVMYLSNIDFSEEQIASFESIGVGDVKNILADVFKKIRLNIGNSSFLNDMMSTKD